MSLIDANIEYYRFRLRDQSVDDLPFPKAKQNEKRVDFYQFLRFRNWINFQQLADSGSKREKKSAKGAREESKHVTTYKIKGIINMIISNTNLF